MSTASDGRDSVGEQDFFDDLRRKYRSAKHKADGLENQLEEMKSKKESLYLENIRMHEGLANTKARLHHAENQLEMYQHHAANSHSRGDAASYHQFEEAMRFLEVALQFIPPASSDHESSSIQGRLVAIIEELCRKEERFAQIAEVNEQLHRQLRENSAITAPAAMAVSGEPETEIEKLQGTLTRIMQNHDAESEKLHNDIDALSRQLAQKEASLRSVTEQLETTVARRDENIGALEFALSEARTKAGDFQRAVDRAEKAKSSMQSSRDKMSMDFKKLQKENKDLEKNRKAKQTQAEDLRKDLNKFRDLYDKLKHTSKTEDSEKIRALNIQLRQTKSKLARAEAANAEKDDELALMKDRHRKLREETNAELEQVGRLQEELAGKDLELSNSRSTSAGFESAARLAEQERIATLQREAQEADMWTQKLRLVERLAAERQDESRFLQASVETLQDQLAEQALSMRQDAAKLRQQDEYVTALKTRLMASEIHVQTLKEAEQETEQTIKILDAQLNTLRKSFEASSAPILNGNQSGHILDEEPTAEGNGIFAALRARIQGLEKASEEQKSRLQVMPVNIPEDEAAQLEPTFKQMDVSAEQRIRTDTEEEGLHMDLHQALDRIATLEELVKGLEEEAARMLRVHKDMTASIREQGERNDAADRELERKKETIERLESNSERLKHDLEAKMSELLDCKSRLLEHESRANVLEEERQSLQHQLATVENILRELQEQLSGRERALERLQEARKTYEKISDSKLERLKEENAAAEKLMLAEITRQRAAHTEEVQAVKTAAEESAVLIRSSREEQIVTLKGDILVLELDRDELKNRLDDVQQELLRKNSEMEERDKLIAGYMQLVREQEDNGLMPEQSGPMAILVTKAHEDMVRIQELTEETSSLRRAMSDQYQIMERYNRNMDDLANRNEKFLRESQERMTELMNEKKARSRQETEYKMKIKDLKEKIDFLERDLHEKIDLAKRLESRLQQHAPANETTTSTSE